jgi:hypothetical protein
MSAKADSQICFFTRKPQEQEVKKRTARMESLHLAARSITTPREVSRRAYNNIMAHAKRQNDSAHEHRRHAAYATETSGLLLIAFLLLLLILVRHWHAIHWSVR